MAFQSILILASLGALITLYISIAHLMKKNVACPINSKHCNIVLNSKYSRTLGIKNEIIGFTYYTAIILVAILFQTQTNIAALKIVSSIAALYSIYLFGIQVTKIKKYCSWCITTALINIIISVLLITKL